jgi:hypothetical protein
MDIGKGKIQASRHLNKTLKAPKITPLAADIAQSQSIGRRALFLCCNGEHDTIMLPR